MNPILFSGVHFSNEQTSAIYWQNNRSYGSNYWFIITDFSEMEKYTFYYFLLCYIQVKQEKSVRESTKCLIV